MVELWVYTRCSILWPDGIKHLFVSFDGVVYREDDVTLYYGGHGFPGLHALAEYRVHEGVGSCGAAGSFRRLIDVVENTPGGDKLVVMNLQLYSHMTESGKVQSYWLALSAVTHRTRLVATGHLTDTEQIQDGAYKDKTGGATGTIFVLGMDLNSQGRGKVSSIGLYDGVCDACFTA